jgi:hypothetical protein
MRSQFTSRDGFVLIKSPSARQLASRRKLAVIIGVVGLALASGIIGSMTRPTAAEPGHAHTGPFSYFPSQ